MHLTKIKLINFQSHKSTVINLNGGFVCIAGKTRSGKSSVLRALNFIFNDIWSDSFIRTGETTLTVEVTLDNNTIVSREKGNGVNKITVTYPDSTVKEFNNFGIQAPVEVKSILGMNPLVIDSDYSENINIHMQDDPHFLITKSAPMKTKFINRLTRLHIIDSVNRSITKELQDINKDLELKSVEIQNVKDKIVQYKNLESLKQFYSELQKKMELVTKVIETINLKYDKLFILATKSAEYFKQKMLYDKRKTLMYKINGISGLLKSYNKTIKFLTLYAKMDHYNKLNTLQLNLLDCYTKHKDCLIKLNTINVLQVKYTELQKLEEQYNNQCSIIDYVKNTIKVCPTCKRPLWSKND